jgi:hypothetical protein
MAITDDLKAQLTHGERIRLVPAKFALSQLIAWKSAVSVKFSGIEGITGIDADESINRLRISVSSASAAGAINSIVAAAGVPAEAVKIDVSAKAVALGSLRGTFRPTGGGVQIQSWDGGPVCTIGFNVTTSTGLNGFVTASHCLNRFSQPGQTGLKVGQPMDAYGYYVGVATNNPLWNRTDPECAGYQSCTIADVMFVKYDVASTLSKRVAFTASPGLNEQGGSITVTGWWDNVVAPAASLFIGQSVDKVSPITGWTRGTISQTCVNTVTEFTVGEHMNLCVDAVTGSRVANGDSGAPVFVPPPAGQIHQPLTPLGILVAGRPINVWNSPDWGDPHNLCRSGCTYFFARWANIQTHLGMSVYPN